MGFSEDFVWGAAAASYQIEGAACEDGKGLSVWDMFCRRKGAVWNGCTGEVACDHYHRYAEDVALMGEMGLGAYRLSISWPRVMPEGVGKVNDKGLAFYDRLVDELLSHNVKPYVTLFHWDYPYELYCRGGWLNRASSDWFAEYAQVVVEKLSDRVKNWMTLNEPQCFIGFGHRDGTQAPGLKLDWPDVLRAAHNALLAHGKGVQAIRAASKGQCRVGYAPVGWVKMPATDSDEDVKAGREANFSMCDEHFLNNTWWMDPIFFGRYPEDGLKIYGAAAPKVEAGDMETISQPLDFLGVNIYNGIHYRMGADGRPQEAAQKGDEDIWAMDWNPTPECLYWGPKFFYERYKTPLIITENGLACMDWIEMDGKVHDPQRIDFLRRYLLQLRKAADEGADIRGYFVWSILDNFEWAIGYAKRFGLIYVDYPTQRRIPKDSAEWYKGVIASNGQSL